MKSFLKGFLVVLALLAGFNSTAFGGDLNCSVSDNPNLDLIDNDNNPVHGSGGDGTDPFMGGITMTGYAQISQITAIAMRACTTVSGTCTLTGDYFCIPISNCSGYTLPNGHTLGNSSTYKALGVQGSGTWSTWVTAGDTAPDVDGISNLPADPSVRVRMWVTKNSVYTDGNYPFSTSRTALCSDL